MSSAKKRQNQLPEWHIIIPFSLARYSIIVAGIKAILRREKYPGESKIKKAAGCSK